MDFDWLPDGTWRYTILDNDEQDKFLISVPLANGNTERIVYLDPNTAQKTLG